MDIKRGEFFLLPTTNSACPTCGVKHQETAPHDATSFRYRYIFSASHPQGKTPTWEDAMAHCDEETKFKLREYLISIGIDPASKDVFGGIKSENELNERVNRGAS